VMLALPNSLRRSGSSRKGTNHTSLCKTRKGGFYPDSIGGSYKGNWTRRVFSSSCGVGTTNYLASSVRRMKTSRSGSPPPLLKNRYQVSLSRKRSR
jgi:hypothetical protein